MNILAVDTAGKTAAVAVLRDDVLLYEAQCNNGLTHSETLLPMIDTALKAAGLTVDDLDVLGVTNGPGSFTGLRIGLAVVKGLALPRQIPCAGVSTMAALAYGLAGEGTVIGAQDARRGQVYWGAFDLAAHDRLTPDTAAPAVIQFVRQLSAGVGIPANLAQLNKVDPADFAALAELALHDTCMSTNQITPTRDEVVAVYTAAFRG